MNAAGFPILSLITWLPLVGGLIIMSRARRRGDRRLQRALDRAVDQPDRVRRCRWSCGCKFDPAEPGFQFVESVVWMPQWGIAYKLGVDGISVLFVLLSTAAHADLHPGELGSDPHARARVHARLPDPGDDDGRHVLRARLRRVLHVLRGRADPDVPDHRRLGRPAARLCGGQVLPLHAGRLGVHAAGAAGDVVATPAPPTSRRCCTRRSRPRCRPGCSSPSSPRSR